MKNLALLFALCAVSMQFASADTLTVTGTGSNQTDGVYAYPYYLSLDGGPSQGMMCLSFDNEISQGESTGQGSRTGKIVTLHQERDAFDLAKGKDFWRVQITSSLTRRGERP